MLMYHFPSLADRCSESGSGYAIVSSPATLYSLFLQIREKDMQIQQLEDESDGLTQTVTKQEQNLQQFAGQEKELALLSLHHDTLQKELQQAKERIRSLQSSPSNRHSTTITERAEQRAPSSPQAGRSGTFIARVTPTQLPAKDESTVVVSNVPVRPHSEHRIVVSNVPIRPRAEQTGPVRSRHSYAADSSQPVKTLAGSRSTSTSNVSSRNSYTGSSAPTTNIAQRRYGRYVYVSLDCKCTY